MRSMRLSMARRAVMGAALTLAFGCSNVLGYDDDVPVQLQEDGPDVCVHGDRGCSLCTLACPRFREWESEIDQLLFGQTRTPEDLIGHYQDIVLARATQPEALMQGQDGGVVSALLIWGLRNGEIDGALTSKLSEDRPWDAEPTVVTDEEGVLATAGRNAILFGEGADSMYRLGPQTELLGRPVVSLASRSVRGAQISIDGETLLRNVQLSTGFVPARIVGVIRSPRLAKGTPLAIAVDGRIAALTRSFPVGGASSFAALVPESAFHDGANTVDVFVVGRRAGGARLARERALRRVLIEPHRKVGRLLTGCSARGGGR